jgi:hypothetical protein
MTGKDGFSDEEWATLLRGPILAGMALSIADPGGPIEVTKELAATLRTVTAPESGSDLVRSVSSEVSAYAQQKRNPVGDFKPRGAMAAQQVLDEIVRVNDVLTAKASPEDAASFRAWMMSVARAAADAAKEGGFMGFGAERVSAGEREMLDRLASALGVDAG